MSGRPKAKLVLNEIKRGALKALLLRRKTAQALALRARIVPACHNSRRAHLMADPVSALSRALHADLGLLA